MQIHAITLFPEMFAAVTDFGVSSRAHKQGIWQFRAINPRSFTQDVHKTVDDRPFGGGPGMVMLAEPLNQAIETAKNEQKQQRDATPKVIYLSPQGVPFTHAKAEELAQESGLILLCGRYEGIDERLLESQVDEEICVGDFVVSGGELPAMMLIDAVLRLKEGVLGDTQSAEQDSFANGLLDCPHYTRPTEFNGMKVPEVLLSGNHALIANWRLTQSLKRTLSRRPDLLANRHFTKQESRLLAQIQEEQDIQK